MSSFNQNKVDGKDEWLTPPDMIKALGEFDLDPCAPIVRPWATASKHYDINDNGLLQPWEGRVWCNPPYGNQMGIWLNKMALHNNGIALVFARTETQAFFNFVWPVAKAVCFIKNRVKFHHVNGDIADGNGGAPSMLIAYGELNAEVLLKSKIKGKKIAL